MELVICEICEGVRPQAHFVYRGGARCRRVPLTFVQWRASFGALDSRREELAYFTCCVRLCRTCSTDSGLWHRGRSALVHCPARQFISMGRRRNDRRPRWRLRWVHHHDVAEDAVEQTIKRAASGAQSLFDRAPLLAQHVSLPGREQSPKGGRLPDGAAHRRPPAPQDYLPPTHPRLRLA